MGHPTDIDAFERHYREVHIPLANQMPGLRRYTVSRNITAVRGGEPPYLVATLDWDDMTALRAAFQSEVGQAIGKDVENLARFATVRSMTLELDDV